MVLLDDFRWLRADIAVTLSVEDGIVPDTNVRICKIDTRNTVWQSGHLSQ